MPTVLGNSFYDSLFFRLKHMPHLKRWCAIS
jgi:hypothetical protein